MFIGTSTVQRTRTVPYPKKIDHWELELKTKFFKKLSPDGTVMLVLYRTVYHTYVMNYISKFLPVLSKKKISLHTFIFHSQTVILQIMRNWKNHFTFSLMIYIITLSSPFFILWSWNVGKRPWTSLHPSILWYTLTITSKNNTRIVLTLVLYCLMKSNFDIKYGKYQN